MPGFLVKRPQGAERPPLFESETGREDAPAALSEVAAVLAEHLEGLYALYGDEQGARVARKHIGWTLRDLPGGEAFRRSVNLVPDARTQALAVRDYFGRLAANENFDERLAA